MATRSTILRFERVEEKCLTLQGVERFDFGCWLRRKCQRRCERRLIKTRKVLKEDMNNE